MKRRSAGWALLLVALASLAAAPSLRAVPPPSAERQATGSAYLPLVQAGDAPTDERFSWSAPIATSPDGTGIWVVNPDSGSVSLLDAITLLHRAEIPVGSEPWSLAVAPDGGSVYVADRAGGTLVAVDARTLVVRATLAVGPEPGGVALSQDGAIAYVSLSAAGAVAAVDTARMALVGRIAVDPQPFALAAGPVNGVERLYVTHLLALPIDGGQEARDDGRAGRVSVIDPATAAVVATIALPPDAHGFPSLLAGIAVAQGRAWVPSTRAAPDLPNGLTTTVFAAVSVLNLATGAEDTAARLLLNDEAAFGSPVSDPVAAVPAPDGQTLYVVLAGSDLVEAIDIADPHGPRLVRFLPAGRNPRGIAISPDGRRGYVMSYLSRAVTVLDLQGLKRVAELPVTDETLDAELLRGKILFNTAADPRVTRGSWVACASCHFDGGSDGVTWMFPDGPRQTPPLWNAGTTLPWHWSAALDEAQDVEQTVELIQHGLGLAPGADEPSLGAPLAGRSADLDALAAFVTRGIRAPAMPPPKGDLAAGRQLFVERGCGACHGGPAWTSSRLVGPAGTLDPDGNGAIDAALRDVGTLNPRDIRREKGFDPPSLLGVGLTPPYLHDGSMPSLGMLLTSGHPNPSAAGGSDQLRNQADLVAFLLSIGPNTPALGDTEMKGKEGP